MRLVIGDLGSHVCSVCSVKIGYCGEKGADVHYSCQPGVAGRLDYHTTKNRQIMNAALAEESNPLSFHRI